MKKASIIEATILISITVSGQVKGIDLENAVKVENDLEISEHHYEQWVRLSQQGIDLYAFTIQNDSAVDYKHLITELDRVLNANGKDINNPDIENDLLPSEIKGLRDYENLSRYVGLEKAQLSRTYNLENGWEVRIVCNCRMQVLMAYTRNTD